MVACERILGRSAEVTAPESSNSGVANEVVGLAIEQAQKAVATRAATQSIYRRLYEISCFDCFRLIAAPGRRLEIGTLKVSLCWECSLGYARPEPEQRLVTKTEAKATYCLRDSDLSGLVCAVDVNPVNPSFVPMNLYRKRDALVAAMHRWGSREAMERERYKRLLR